MSYRLFATYPDLRKRFTESITTNQRKPMIERVQSFKTSTGKVCETIEEARKDELESLLSATAVSSQIVETVGADSSAVIATRDAIVTIIIAHSARVVDILTTTATSIPKARKANGHVRTRRTKAEIAASKLENKEPEKP